MEASEIERLKVSDPLCVISVKDRVGKEIRLMLWERMLPGQGEKKKDTDRLWGKTDSSSGIFVIRYMDIDPLLKRDHISSLENILFEFYCFFCNIDSLNNELILL
jgi:hypothetical protein